MLSLLFRLSAQTACYFSFRHNSTLLLFRQVGFRCLVVLERGSSEALRLVNSAASGEEKLLRMRNKWLTCHPDSPQKEGGAYVGIHGEKLTVKIKLKTQE